MVMVQGTEVIEAESSEDLFNIFLKGSTNRHTASTSELCLTLCWISCICLVYLILYLVKMREQLIRRVLRDDKWPFHLASAAAAISNLSTCNVNCGFSRN